MDNEKWYDRLVEIEQRYVEPHRRYHNLDHIKAMFAEAEKQDIELTFTQTIAIWYHDAIYNPGSKTNEEDSAALFMHDAVPEYQTRKAEYDEIFDIILATKNHRKRDNPRINEVIDLDIAGLGSTWEAYIDNSKRIFEEYNVPWKNFVEGRKVFLKMYMGRDKLFTTEKFFKLYENDARRNMIAELKCIGGA